MSPGSSRTGAGPTADTVVFDQVTMPSGKATVRLGAGANLFTPTTSTIDGGIAYTGGAGDDTVVVTDTTTPRDLKIAAGAGVDTLVLSTVAVGGVVALKDGADVDVVTYGSGSVAGNVTGALGAGPEHADARCRHPSANAP